MIIRNALSQIILQHEFSVCVVAVLVDQEACSNGNATSYSVKYTTQVFPYWYNAC